MCSTVCLESSLMLNTVCLYTHTYTLHVKYVYLHFNVEISQFASRVKFTEKLNCGVKFNYVSPPSDDAGKQENIAFAPFKRLLKSFRMHIDVLKR